jgi:hypothetical protein
MLPQRVDGRLDIRTGFNMGLDDIFAVLVAPTNDDHIDNVWVLFYRLLNFGGLNKPSRTNRREGNSRLVPRSPRRPFCVLVDVRLILRGSPQ